MSISLAKVADVEQELGEGAEANKGFREALALADDPHRAVRRLRSQSAMAQPSGAQGEAGREGLSGSAGEGAPAESSGAVGGAGREGRGGDSEESVGDATAALRGRTGEGAEAGASVTDSDAGVPDLSPALAAKVRTVGLSPSLCRSLALCLKLSAQAMEAPSVAFACPCEVRGRELWGHSCSAIHHQCAEMRCSLSRAVHTFVDLLVFCLCCRFLWLYRGSELWL